MIITNVSYVLIITGAGRDELLEVDKNSIKTFMHVLFSGCSGYIPCRSFAEKEGFKTAKSHNIWFEADEAIVDKGYKFADQTNKRRMGCFVIPGTVNKLGHASSSDIVEMQVLLIDIDEGNTEEKLNILTNTLGQPTLIVESGGITNEGKSKLHIYWQLVHAVTGNRLQQLLQLRHQIALAVGGDTHFKSAHQPIRVAGSVYHKGGTGKLVKIRSYEPVEYELEELIDACGNLLVVGDNEQTVPITPLLSVQNTPSLSVNQLMTTKVYSGGDGECSRFNNLQRIIGFWLRRYHEGNVSMEQAWQEIIDYNAANVMPPWSEERLRQMANGLWKKHVSEHGNESNKHQNKTTSINLKDWTAERYKGTAPTQEYLVESVIPMRVVTILAATGDAGKSMMLLNLALQVTSDNPLATSFGYPITQRGTAIIFTAEDDIEEVHRRLERLDPSNNRLKHPEKLIIVPLPSIGSPLSCIIKNKDGIKVSPEFLELKKQLLLIENLKLLVFDPLSSFVQADIAKDPNDGSFVTGVFANLATETGAAVILTHHMRKPQGNYQISTPEQAREAVRGTGALVDGVRNVYSLWQASMEEQELVFGVFDIENKRNRVYRGAVVKSNISTDRSIHLYLRSNVGLLENITTKIHNQELSNQQLKNLLCSAIAYSAKEGFPYTHTGQNGVYRQRHKLPQVFHNIARKKLEELIQEMLNSRPAVIVKGRAAGSKEEKWLDVPDGDFARGEGKFTEGAEMDLSC